VEQLSFKSGLGSQRPSYSRKRQMVKARTGTVMRLCVQDEVKQDESEGLS